LYAERYSCARANSVPAVVREIGVLVVAVSSTRVSLVVLTAVDEYSTSKRTDGSKHNNAIARVLIGAVPPVVIEKRPFIVCCAPVSDIT
jgi:hypothetical protein